MEKRIVKKKVTLSPRRAPAQKPAPRVAAAKKETAAVSAARYGLHSLAVPPGMRHKKKLLGRGSSSGHGKTSTRGSKGQTSRAGRHFYLGFEGGQSPLIRRMPKRGFTSRSKDEFQIVNLGSLGRVKGDIVNPETLAAAGLIKDKAKPVKILGDGELKNPVTVQAHAFSKSALEKLKGCGARTEVLNA